MKNLKGATATQKQSTESTKGKNKCTIETGKWVWQDTPLVKQDQKTPTLE